MTEGKKDVQIKGIKAATRMRIDSAKIMNNEEVPALDTTRSEIAKISKKADDDDLSRLKNWQTVKDLEKMGAPKELIDKYRQKSGVLTEGQPVQNANVNQFQQMLAMKITQAETPEDKASLLQLSQMISNDSGQINNPVFLAALMGNTSRKTKTEEQLMVKVLDKMLDQATKTPEKVDELALFEKMTTIVEKVQKMTASPDTVDDLLKNVEAYKKLGIVKDGSNTDDVEKMKIELEKTKIEKDFELEQMKVEQEGTRYKELSKVGGEVVGSIISAFVSSQEGEQIDEGVNKTLSDAASQVPTFKSTCQKCKKPMLLTDIENSRQIACPNCDQKYQLDGTSKKLFLIRDEDPTSTSSSDSKVGTGTSSLKNI